MGLFLELSFLILLIHSNVAVYLIPKQILTQIGASYTVMLVDDDENIRAKQCFLTSSSNSSITYEIDLTTSGVPLKPNNTGQAPVDENTNIMTSLGYGKCGFKLDNLGNNYVSRWNISFVDENKQFYYKDIDVIPMNKKTENKTQYVRIGNSFAVSCWDSSILNYLLNCQLFDPQGTLVLSSNYKTECSHYVETSKISDFGVWKCILQFESNMSPRNIYHNIIEKENVNINLWQNETKMHVNIGCSINNLDARFSGDTFCEMIRPDGEIFSLKEGLATDRYTALGTNVNKAICGMEIKKPLEDFEKGLWRCEFKNVYSQNQKYPIGGFINLSNGTNALPPAEIQKNILTFARNSFSISCRVPYSSSYCYVRGPNKNGTIYPVTNNLEPTLGLCKFTKNDASMRDNGTWFCGFAKKTGEVDELYSFEVVVLERIDVKPEKEKVEGSVGGTVHLKCSTKGIGDYPVQYCRFKNSYEQMYNINSEEKSTNRMSYYGRGFKYGDCGIELKNVSISDAGMWTCITRIGNDFKYPEIYRHIDLRIY